eukprot:244929_1
MLFGILNGICFFFTIQLLLNISFGASTTCPSINCCSECIYDDCDKQSQCSGKTIQYCPSSECNVLCSPNSCNGAYATINCNAGHACYGATIYCSKYANCYIECEGSNSCRNAIIWCPPTSYKCSMDCGGDFSCDGYQKKYYKPTTSPTPGTKSPTPKPTPVSVSPTISPTKSPTKKPSVSPIKNPTIPPSNYPSKFPSNNPTVSPSEYPTKIPTISPTAHPTNLPSNNPTITPTKSPTYNPSKTPTTAPTTTSEILVSESACYNSKNFATKWTFNPPYNGIIIGIKLVYDSGSVNCDYTRFSPTKWGCVWQQQSIMIEMIKQFEDNDVQTYYPTATTNGIYGIKWFNSNNCNRGHTCSIWYYHMQNYGNNGSIIEIVDNTNPYSVCIEDVFSIQYSEGCCNFVTGDNAGSACADVYFLYSEFYPTTNPTLSPTENPSISPSTDPSTLPSNNPSISPTSNPSVSPSINPTKNPTNLPTNNPTIQTTNEPTSEPTNEPTSEPTLEPT